MKKKVALSTILILFVFGSVFFTCSLISTDNPNNNLKYNDDGVKVDNLNNDNKPKIAATLNYSNIIRNTTEPLRRVFDSINITIDVSQIVDANFTIMFIKFSNRTEESFNMTQIGISDRYSYIFTPRYYDPLGLQLVRFWVLNISSIDSSVKLLNTGTRFITNFTIRANADMNINPLEYNRGDELETNLVIDGSVDFDWMISVVDSEALDASEVYFSEETQVFIVGNDIFHVNFTVNESFAQENKFYYLKVNLTKSDKMAVAYFQFKVLAPDSIILASSISFVPGSVFRLQKCILNLNVSAIENDLNPLLVNVSLTLKDPNSVVIFNSRGLDNNWDSTFSTSFLIGETNPIGKYGYTLTADYRSVQIDEYEGLITVKNNLPIIDGYEINKYDTDESISVNYGEDLTFEFDVSDVEGVAYVTLLLVDEDDEEYEITRAYEEDLEIVVRTVDLVEGRWEVYVYVIDTDGVSVGLDEDYDKAPQEITIISDTFSEVLPWFTLIIGLILGILAGVGITYLLVKAQKTEPEVSKKEVISKKKPKHEKQKQVPAEPEVEEQEIKKAKQEKEEPRKVTPRRKIKRKLK